MQHIQPETVWDLGANTGLFSRIPSQMGVDTIAFDIDPGAVELNYRDCRKTGEIHLLPLLLDLTNPSPAIGWGNRERSAFGERGPAGAVMALALVHHLAIANNVPLPRLADFMHGLGRWLVIEFVPKSDSQVQRLLASRQDIFPDYTPSHFESAFSQRYILHRSEAIRDSERCLYLMEART
jgi:ribosomal protein L11 methylase PrmA